MKKIILFIVTIFLILPSTVNAATGDITNLSASYANKSVTVTGNTLSSILAISVILYDTSENESGETVLRMVNDSVANNSFSTTIDSLNLVAGSTYKIKVANFDGGNYYETTFTVPTESTNNPNTGDEIISSVILGSLSSIGLAGAVLYRKKKDLIK